MIIFWGRVLTPRFVMINFMETDGIYRLWTHERKNSDPVWQLIIWG